MASHIVYGFGWADRGQPLESQLGAIAFALEQLALQRQKSMAARRMVI
jgi:hypothetical protein